MPLPIFTYWNKGNILFLVYACYDVTVYSTVHKFEYESYAKREGEIRDPGKHFLVSNFSILNDGINHNNASINFIGRRGLVSFHIMQYLILHAIAL